MRLGEQHASLVRCAVATRARSGAERGGIGLVEKIARAMTAVAAAVIAPIPYNPAAADLRRHLRIRDEPGVTLAEHQQRAPKQPSAAQDPGLRPPLQGDRDGTAPRPRLDAGGDDRRRSCTDRSGPQRVASLDETTIATTIRPGVPFKNPRPSFSRPATRRSHDLRPPSSSSSSPATTACVRARPRSCSAPRARRARGATAQRSSASGRSEHRQRSAQRQDRRRRRGPCWARS